MAGTKDICHLKGVAPPIDLSKPQCPKPNGVYKDNSFTAAPGSTQFNQKVRGDFCKNEGYGGLNAWDCPIGCVQKGFGLNRSDLGYQGTSPWCFFEGTNDVCHLHNKAYVPEPEPVKEPEPVPVTPPSNVVQPPADSH